MHLSAGYDTPECGMRCSEARDTMHLTYTVTSLEAAHSGDLGRLLNLANLF